MLGTSTQVKVPQPQSPGNMSAGDFQPILIENQIMLESVQKAPDGMHIDTNLTLVACQLDANGTLIETNSTLMERYLTLMEL